MRSGRPVRLTGRLTTTAYVTLYPLRAILASCPGFRLAEDRSVPIRTDGTYRAAFTLRRRGDYRLWLQFNADATHQARAIVYLRAR